MSRVAIVRCQDYDRERVSDAVAEAFEALGGAAQFTSETDEILLKPNILKGAPPESALTTHHEILRAVAEQFQNSTTTPRKISMGDSPAWGSLASCAEQTGLSRVCEELKLPLTQFRKGVKVPNPEGVVYAHLTMAKEAMDADGIINLPKLKTHCQLYMTGAVKNLFGCVAGKRKAWWHFKAGTFEDYFPLMLVETARLLKTRLSVLDAVYAMEGQGPAQGTPRRVGLIIASADPVALDRVACEVSGLSPEKLRTLEAARVTGFGETDLDKIEVAGLPLQEARLSKPLVEPRMIPIGFSIPRVVKSTLKQQWLTRVQEPLRKIS